MCRIWHARMPSVLKRLDVAASSVLETVSPWAATCLPAATRALGSALGDESISIGRESPVICGSSRSRLISSSGFALVGHAAECRWSRRGRLAQRTDSAAATCAVQKNVQDYPNCAATPFVMEDHGRLGGEAIDPAECSASIQRLHQPIGATLQRYAADVVLLAAPVF